MSVPLEVREEFAPLPFAEGGRGLVRWLGTSNPFYVISALLVLLGLWISFGAQVRQEQTWALMAGLAGYTLLLAVPACLLVRYGGVWQDMRTVLLLVVLMFLATSVTFDETLARSPRLGVACYIGGFVFAVLLSEGVLRGIRLVLPSEFRVPYYLALGLFFLYPAALVPLLDRPGSEALEWALFGFSPAAGLLCLTLLPAVRRGPASVANGSPWPWPYYPWSLFVFLAVGVLGRSYLLCWSMQHVARKDPEPMIFGLYFLVPFLLGVALIVLEAGRVARSRGMLGVALALPAGLVVLAGLGDRPDELFHQFRALFTARLGGTPLYLALLASVGFYGYAVIRRVPRAGGALTAALLALAVVGPRSLDLDTLVSPRPWPLLAAGALQAGWGLAARVSSRTFFGALGLIAGGWLALPETPHGAVLVFHLTLAAVLGVGAAFDDLFARGLRRVGLGLVLLACAVVLCGGVAPGRSAPGWAIGAYPPLMAALLAGYGRWLRDRPAWVCGRLVLVGWLATFGGRGYATLRPVVLGLDYIAAGLAMLVVAELISLGKAGLLPRRTALLILAELIGLGDAGFLPRRGGKLSDPEA